MKLEFREAREADVESLFWVRAHTRENPVPMERLASLGITPASYAAALRTGAIKGWVCVHEGRVVGFCTGDPASGEVLVLAVLPAHEGQGIGKRLLLHVVEWLRSQHRFARLWLAASPDPRIRAHGFYRSQGWRPTGERDASGDEILVLELNQRRVAMGTFSLPADISFNRGPIHDPAGYAGEVGCVSWLCLTGGEFAAMDGRLSYEQVRLAVPFSANVVSDPPRVLDLDLARRHVAALDQLPRPTLVSCRTGPRASAVAYLYAGLKQGAEADEVLAAAESDAAPFCQFPEYREWVRDSLQRLRAELAE